MAHDVSLGSTSGVDNLVRRWGLFSRYFPDVQVQLKQLKHITEHSLIAFTTTSFTISAASLLDVFPHLIKAREGSRSAQIAAKLRDQHLVFQGSVCFDWDEENKRVIGLQAQVDTVSVLVRMLGSLEDVALMFNNAFITPDCNLRSDADFSQNGFAF